MLGCSSLSGGSGCSVACPLWLLWLPARLLRLSACPLWLLAFIPYAKVKKLILTHYILFIWKDRSMFFSDVAFPSRMLFSPLPDGSPWHQHLCHSAASRHGTPGQQLRHSAPASNSAAAPQPAALPRLRLSAVALPRRPGQQQTSSGGEKYSGLASNMAHLGRIC